MYEGLKPDTYSDERLMAWRPIDLDRLYAAQAVKARVYSLTAILWSVATSFALLYCVASGDVFAYAIGFPLTACYIRYCYKVREARERACELAVLCDLDSLAEEC